MNTGRDLRKVLERRNLLDDDAGITTMKEILYNIGKTVLATKLKKHSAIGVRRYRLVRKSCCNLIYIVRDLVTCWGTSWSFIPNFNDKLFLFLLLGSSAFNQSFKNFLRLFIFLMWEILIRLERVLCKVYLDAVSFHGAFHFCRRY